MTTIDSDNYELWLLGYAEGELTAAERAEVEAWLAAHPEGAEELALYQEAPRLERDERVRYAAPAPRRLWPVLARWSAAAAVVAALMVPAMRMGEMVRLPQAAEPASALLAQVLPEDSGERGAGLSREARVSRGTSYSRETSYSRDTRGTGYTGDTCEAPAPAAEPLLPPAPIATDALIAFDTPALADTLASRELIAFDTSTDWGDRLLAANDAAHESLSQSFGGRIVSRLLPDSRQLEESLVEPLRERANQIRNKRK